MTVVTCPECGFQFDTSYGRIMVCGSCPSATMGNCGYAKCPRCQHEFALDSGLQQSNQFGRHVA